MKIQYIDVIGIMINENDKDYLIYKSNERFDIEDATLSYGGGSIDRVQGAEKIAQFLLPLKSQYTIPAVIIVYDVSCAQKEEHIKKVLAEINKIKNDSTPLPILMSIGHEDSSLSDEITEAVSAIKEIVNTDELEKDGIDKDELLGAVVEQENKDIVTQLKLALQLDKKQVPFNGQLKLILEKASQLRKDGHLTAADAADHLYKKLNTQAQNYFSDPTEEAYNAFKEQAKAEIKQAHIELDKHRGWKRVLGNVFLAIIGFGVLYLAAVLINRNVFFNNTDSSEKLDELESNLSNNTYQITG